ncbi:MAG: glycerol-3-phosphate dehydrogenase, partial [Candidatus Macondimonas sp.]
FIYSDAWVQDARLVVLNAMDAQARGARIATRTTLVAAQRGPTAWSLDLRSADGRCETVQARVLVNSTGPWVGTLLGDVLGLGATHAVRLVKGSHIVVKRLFDHHDAYLFQNPDRRIIFAIPFEGRFTLIGTTDVDYSGDPARAAITAEEIAYLCRMASRYFSRALTPAEVVWSYAGVRPLLDDAAGDAASVTRDYTLELDTEAAPVLSVFGGKLTTYRKLAEQAVARIQPLLGNRVAPWTAGASLPGGDFPRGDFDGFLAQVRQHHGWLPTDLAFRLARNYGTRIERILHGVSDLAGLGEAVLPGLYACELDYLVREEFARTAEDILWRRTKLGLVAPPDATAHLQAWLDARPKGR